MFCLLQFGTAERSGKGVDKQKRPEMKILPHYKWLAFKNSETYVFSLTLHGEES